MSDTPKTPAPLTAAELQAMRERLWPGGLHVPVQHGESYLAVLERMMHSSNDDLARLLDEVESLWRLFADLRIDEDALARAEQRGREAERKSIMGWMRDHAAGLIEGAVDADDLLVGQALDEIADDIDAPQEAAP